MTSSMDAPPKAGSGRRRRSAERPGSGAISRSERRTPSTRSRRSASQLSGSPKSRGASVADKAQEEASPGKPAARCGCQVPTGGRRCWALPKWEPTCLPRSPANFAPCRAMFGREVRSGRFAQCSRGAGPLGFRRPKHLTTKWGRMGDERKVGSHHRPNKAAERSRWQTVPSAYSLKAAYSRGWTS